LAEPSSLSIEVSKLSDAEIDDQIEAHEEQEAIEKKRETAALALKKKFEAEGAEAAAAAEKELAAEAKAKDSVEYSIEVSGLDEATAASLAEQQAAEKKAAEAKAAEAQKAEEAK
jgi:hypothetical protein